MVGIRQPKRVAADTALKRLLKDKPGTRQRIREIMTKALTDESFWSGGDGVLNIKRLLEELGFPKDTCGRLVTGAWKAFLQAGLVLPDWKYRLAIILEAQGYDSRRWVEIHYFERSHPMYKQVMIEVNLLLRENRLGLRISEKAAQFYIRFLKRQRASGAT